MAVAVRYRVRAGKKVRFYQAIVIIGGQWQASKSFTSRAEAQEWHDNEKRLRSLGFECSKIEEGYTLIDLVEEYRKIEEPTKRRSTVESDAIRWRYFIESPLAETEVAQINPSAIDCWFNFLHTHDCVNSYRRISFNRELKLFKAILNWYRENKDYSYSVPFLKRHQKRTKIAGKVSLNGKSLDRYMTEEQVSSWLDLLSKKSNLVYYQLARFMVMTGFRVGEACGLEWQHINFENKTISIRQTMSWDRKTKRPYLQIGEAKNEMSLRTIQLPNELRQMLLTMKIKNPKGLVFKNAKGEGLHYSSLYNTFSITMKKSFVMFSGTHICRHTFATLALKVSKSTSEVQEILGHSTIKQTEKYAKISVLNLNDTPNKVSRLIEETNMNARTTSQRSPL